MEKNIYDKLKINIKCKKENVGFRLKGDIKQRSGIIKENDDEPFFSLVIKTPKFRKKK